MYVSIFKNCLSVLLQHWLYNFLLWQFSAYVKITLNLRLKGQGTNYNGLKNPNIIYDYHTLRCHCDYLQLIW